MPLYEYECDACGHRFEKIQKFSDALEDTCPKCGGVVHKLVSSPAIQFKGSGFYINDYARKGTGAGSDSSENSDSKKDSDPSKTSSAEPSTPAKPAKNYDRSGGKPAAPAQKQTSMPPTT